MNGNCRTDGSVEQIRQMHEIFYGTSGENQSHQQRRYRQAMELCNTCPALAECRQWAFDNWRAIGDDLFKGHQNKGSVGFIIAGLTSRERWEHRRGQRPQPRPVKDIEHGTARGYRLHLTRGEQACEDCRVAERVRERERRNRQKQKQTA